jgi:hypothetical protein
MAKILIGAATAAVWFTLSYAAHAESVCPEVCDNAAIQLRSVEGALGLNAVERKGGNFDIEMLTVCGHHAVTPHHEA